MNNLKVGLVVLGLYLVSAVPARAMEGTAVLGSEGGEMGSCFAASVYIEGRYRVLMTCRGLRSALDPVRNRYVAWVKDGDNFKRLGEVVNGKMRASIDREFEEIAVTAERDGYGNKPEGTVLLSGKMEEVVFDGVKIPEEEEVILPEPDEPIDDRGAVVPEPESKPGVAAAFKVLGKALVTGFLVLLGIVGVLSYLSRNKKT